MSGGRRITKTEIALLFLAAGVAAGMFVPYPTRDASAKSGYEVTASARRDTETERMEKIDLNTATAEELTLLPQIGQALAERIVSYREENGRFDTAEDLLNVDGIGEKTLDAIREYILLGR